MDSDAERRSKGTAAIANNWTKGPKQGEQPTEENDMNEQTEEMDRFDEMNLSLNRAAAVADLVFSYGVANSDTLPNLARGTLLNAMLIIQGELDGIRALLRAAQGTPPGEVASEGRA